MKMILPKTILALAFLTALFMASISASAAAAPPNQPMTIVSEGFESALGAAWQTGPWEDPVRPSAAWWGRMSNVRRTGTFSLWCAGTRAGGLDGVWGNYPAATGGHAVLRLPELAGYYSSAVSFHYTMPTVGAADFFSFSWHADGAVFGDSGGEFFTTAAGAWVERRFVFSSAANTANLSRTPGSMRFQFLDNAEGPLQLPQTGQGPSVDDVVVTGYKYGPVRNLSASTTNTGGVVLRWGRPVRAIGSTAPEERVISYRIWRRPTGTAAWTELPRAGNGALSFVDTTALANVWYEYSVIAHDPIPGSGYGQPMHAVQGLRVTATGPPRRIFGNDRITTAIVVAREAFPEGARNVIITTGWDYPDALSASALAGALDAPILLVRPASSGDAVLQAIDELGVTKAYIVGGTAAVSDNVRHEIDSLPGVSVTRISGANRFATAGAVAREVSEITSPATLFLATGQNFPDALAASSLAANGRWPILLTNWDALHPETDAVLRLIRPARVVILGGGAAVSPAVENAIRGNPAYGSPQVIRRAGANRYATAKSVIEWGVSATGGNLVPPGTGGIRGLHLATGMNFPDALSAGVLAGRPKIAWRPLMLTDPLALSPAARDVITGNRGVSYVTVIGGFGAVSAQVETAARNLVSP